MNPMKSDALEDGLMDDLPCVVARHPHGISLNGLEYLYEDGDTEFTQMKVFDTRDDALAFLAERGMTVGEMETLRFFLFEGRGKTPSYEI